MDKFIEELNSGDSFEIEGKRFLLTSDYKKNGLRLSIDMNNGSCRWFEADCHVSLISLYIMDSNSNFMPIKEIQSDVPPQIKNIP
jgi:hypothetical protein